jgi:hypothetical protein
MGRRKRRRRNKMRKKRRRRKRRKKKRKRRRRKRRRKKKKRRRRRRRWRRRRQEHCGRYWGLTVALAVRAVRGALTGARRAPLQHCWLTIRRSPGAGPPWPMGTWSLRRAPKRWCSSPLVT